MSWHIMKHILHMIKNGNGKFKKHAAAGWKSD